MITARWMAGFAPLVLGLFAAAAVADEPAAEESLISPEMILAVPHLEVASSSSSLQEPAPALDHGLRAEIAEAARQYSSSGRASVIERSTRDLYPFGESQPVVECSPLRACDVELQEGEVVRGVALGDTDRWIAKPLLSGEVDHAVPHVIVKPTAYGLTTNMVVGTTRRTYHLILVSPSESDVAARRASGPRHVAFYYPDELVATWASEEALRQQHATHREDASIADFAVSSLDQLNFSYLVKPQKKVSWAPITVFDDGEHVYIQLPATARSGDLPALLVEAEGGDLGLSNYRVQGLWYVVDGLFPRAELVVGVGRQRRKVEIVNQRLAGSRGPRHAG